MHNQVKTKIEVQGIVVNVHAGGYADFISLTDLAKYKNVESPSDVIKNWMRLRNTIDYLGLWESMNNDNFNSVGFDLIKNEAGTNSFVLSPKKWVASTNAIGIKTSSGRYSAGTYSHSDIAFKFAAWLSVEFELYVIKEFQRLKTNENHQKQLEWNVRRELSKTNYKIHTDSIKLHLITEDLTSVQISHTYASEADVLNVALFDMTAKEWREKNSSKKGNIRDYASIEELIVLSNLENMNAEMINQGRHQCERLMYLRKMAHRQLKAIIGLRSIEEIKRIDKQKPNQKMTVSEITTGIEVIT